ncbi:MAG TPA: gamma-glutamyltransferase family protein [Candidatus Sumerlaeota bacterium]|nr:gamma-glutamyltransferase family protein [Candidatus Sumerlaeota bacterium]
MLDRRTFLGALGLGGLGLLAPPARAEPDPAARFHRPERPWPAFTTRPVLMARRDVVTAGHYLAAAAGWQMIAAGGNAFDAAVAMGFASAVLEPQYFGLGGEASILLYSAERNKALALSGQGVAPRAATIDWFRAHGIDSIPGTGFLPLTIPACPAAYFELLRQFGTLPAHEVLAPALDLAENGYPAHLGAINAIHGASAVYPTTRRAYTPAGGQYEVGELIRIPGLAATFRALIDASRVQPTRERGIAAAHDAFYQGPIARRMAEFATTEASGFYEGIPGLLSVDDLAAFSASVEEPVRARYRGYDVCKCGPWSQGPVFLQQLKLLEGFDLRALGHNSADYLHTLIEAAKLAFADRDAFYGDPNFVDVPLDRLLSEPYADERRALIDPNRASLDIRPGDGAPLPAPAVHGLPDDTTHLDAIDRHGNMVAITPSGGWITHSPVIPDLGFSLGVRGQMFWLDPAHPNRLQPGKRPRTTLSPTLVMRDGEPLMVFGTLGGDAQDQWTLQFFLNYIDFGMNLQEAIDAPTVTTYHFHQSWAGHSVDSGKLTAEDRIDPRVIEELTARGHNVQLVGDWSHGRVLAAAVDSRAGIRRAAASPRAETGYAYGW